MQFEQSTLLWRGWDLTTRPPPKQTGSPTNSATERLVIAAHALLFKPSFICAPKDGQERARKMRQWNLEQCAGGGQNHDLSHFSRGARFSLCPIGASFIWIQHYSMPQIQRCCPFCHQRSAIFGHFHIGQV